MYPCKKSWFGYPNNHPSLRSPQGRSTAFSLTSPAREPIRFPQYLDPVLNKQASVGKPCAGLFAPPCRVPDQFEPAFAGGILHMVSTLAEAYRVRHRHRIPSCLVLAQMRMRHHKHSRARSLYHDQSGLTTCCFPSSGRTVWICKSASCFGSTGEGALPITSRAA